MLGQLEALLKAPPGAAGSATGNRPFSTSITGVASSATLVTSNTANDPAAIPELGCFVTWVSDTDCYLRVGDANVGSATTSDMFVPSGVTFDWWHNGKTQLYFSVLQKTAGGTIKRYRSSI
jgi:hypothetical protein